MVRSSFLRVAHRLGTAGLIAAISMVTALAGLAQEGPIQLFPERGTPAGAEAAPKHERQQIPAPSERSILPRPDPSPSEPAGEFVVEGLAAPELDAIGLSGPTEGGFDRPLWQDADHDLGHASC